MEVTFLGTGSMVPTKDRNQSGVFISYKKEGFLLDCGESIQRQLRIAKIKPTKITKILITHWHGDHVFGLPGLLSTLSHMHYQKTLRIFGPRGTKEKLTKMFEAFIFENNLKIDIKEVNEGVFFKSDDYILKTRELDHRIKCLGFSLEEKNKRRIIMSKVKKLGLTPGPLLGKLQKGRTVVFNGKTIKAEQVTEIIKGRKITYITDTAICKSCFQLAKNSDLLISESTYSSEFEEKAREYKHMTASQAASIALKSKSKQLVLTHFSQRFKTTNILVKEARSIFKKTVAAKDFMKIKL